MKKKKSKNNRTKVGNQKLKDMVERKKTRKIILEIPTIHDLSKGHKIFMRINIKMNKDDKQQYINYFNSSFEIDVLEFLKKTMKKLGGKINFE